MEPKLEIDKKEHFQQLEHEAAKRTYFWRIAKQTTLLVLAVAAFLIFFLTSKLKDAFDILMSGPILG